VDAMQRIWEKCTIDEAATGLHESMHVHFDPEDLFATRACSDECTDVRQACLRIELDDRRIAVAGVLSAAAAAAPVRILVARAASAGRFMVYGLHGWAR